jgi:hypothetical protein
MKTAFARSDELELTIGVENMCADEIIAIIVDNDNFHMTTLTMQLILSF